MADSLGYRGYVFSRPFLGERVPQRVQNLVIRDYCQTNGMVYLLSATEYAMNGCHMILEQVIDEIETVDGVVAYSLFNLPTSMDLREEIYEKVLAKNRSMHFAVEGLKLEKRSHVGRLEDIWKVRQIIDHGAGQSGWDSI